MDPKLEYIAVALKAARQARRISQRELGAAIGMPQAHISKIEAGAVNLTLASLIDLARALELEVMLIPRRAIPIVESLAAQQSAMPNRSVHGPAEPNSISRPAYALDWEEGDA